MCIFFRKKAVQYSTTKQGELPPMLLRSQHLQRMIIAAEDAGDILIARAEIWNAQKEYGKDFLWYDKHLNSLADAKLVNINLQSLRDKRAFA